ncbi:uncharacterized protein LOC116773511 isoform X3 [Danaus plexippus]|uniref:uncharacterized protein LOC116773511 isoform X3 n=1 Tax=Danaus plexippus TaxID=13037 RepID=UPI002AB1579F|nr:uncharacterized protein LOC116773511 isoform X3 [Danaus plexippus]
MASVVTLAVLVCVSCVLVCVYGHVALTFPPARKYDLDFLDNSRTKPPCGMPKGSIRTSFLAGSTFTVHWHLAYAHRGGFSLRILDYLERPLLDLTPRAGGSEFVRDDVTAQKYEVHLPSDFTCDNCTLQLQREAGEWGQNYRFWSCADIDIVTRKTYHETCSSRGFHILSRCKCNRLYSGDRCQYSNECLEDGDCGLRGRCVRPAGHSAAPGPGAPGAGPRSGPLASKDANEGGGVCYCAFGFYGKGCSKKAPWKDKNINLELYTKKQLSKDFALYWRVLKEEGEMEVAMIVNGTSYAGIGWRPKGLKKECKNFPVLGPPMENQSTPAPEPLPKPEPKSEPEAVPEPKSEPEPTPEPKSEQEPTPEPKAEPEPTPEPKAEPEPEPSAEPEPVAEDTNVPENDNRNKRVAMHTLDGFDFKNLGNDVTYKTSVSFKVSTSKGRKKRDVESDKPGYFPSHEFAPKFDFNPMDCTDIVIGSAKGNYHRVMDYYTRDRSTPRVDKFWGGKDDVTSASGYEENGVTTILFRKKIKATEPSDHSIVDDLMHVIWARGQEYGPLQGKGQDNVTRNFYGPDDLKYHGHGAQRGVATINFFDEQKSSQTSGVLSLEDDKCGGQWRYPSNCNNTVNNTCSYTARWEYLGEKRGKDSVRFTITTRQSKLWTGIGFSNDKKMSQSDAVVGWVDSRSNRPVMRDVWLSGYKAPAADNRQDVTQISGSLVDGVTTLSFVRKRDTGDGKDLPFTNTKCLYMMFVVAGGNFDPTNKRMSKHTDTPLVTEERVCIKPCGPEPEEDPFTTLPPPPPGSRSYSLLMKITGLGDSYRTPAVGTAEYDDLKTKITNGFDTTMSGVKGYQGIAINGFMQNETKSIIADITFNTIEIEDKTASLTPEGNDTDIERDEERDEEIDRDIDREKWYRAIKDTLAEGKVGNLIVDPEFLVFQQVITSPSSPAPPSASSPPPRLWLVAGCVCLLAALAALQAACTLATTRRKDRLMPTQAWKEYASANTNYAFEPFENDDKYNTTSRPPTRPTSPPPPRPTATPKPHKVTPNGHVNGHNTTPRNGQHKPYNSNHNGQNGHNGHNVHNGHNGNNHSGHDVIDGYNRSGRKYSPGRRTPSQYYPETRSLQRPRNQYGRTSAGSTLSLPRGSEGPSDFYFMPSQRKHEDF